MSVSSDRRPGAAQRELLVAPVPLSPVAAAAVVTMGTLMALPHAAGGVPRATGALSGDAPGVPSICTSLCTEQGERPLLTPAATPRSRRVQGGPRWHRGSRARASSLAGGPDPTTQCPCGCRKAASGSGKKTECSKTTRTAAWGRIPPSCTPGWGQARGAAAQGAPGACSGAWWGGR